MKKAVLTALVTLLLFAPTVAYPPSHPPSEAPLYQDAGKRGLADYDRIQTQTLNTYKTEQRNSRTFELYNPKTNSRTFVDLKERDSRDPAFELYHRVEETYEKAPRFRY